MLAEGRKLPKSLACISDVGALVLLVFGILSYLYYVLHHSWIQIKIQSNFFPPAFISGCVCSGSRSVVYSKLKSTEGGIWSMRIREFQFFETLMETGPATPYAQTRIRAFTRVCFPRVQKQQQQVCTTFLFMTQMKCFCSVNFTSYQKLFQVFPNSMVSLGNICIYF